MTSPSPEAIQEFQRIYVEEFGDELDDGKAQEMAHSILSLVVAVGEAQLNNQNEYGKRTFNR